MFKQLAEGQRNAPPLLPCPLTLHAKVKQLIWLSIDINLARGASSTMGNQGLKQRCLYNALLLCCFWMQKFHARNLFLMSAKPEKGYRNAGGGGERGQAGTAADTSKNVKQLSRQEKQREGDQQNTLHFIYIISFFFYFFTTR